MLKKIAATINSFSSDFLQNLERPKTRDVIIGIVVFVVCFLAMASVSTKALINGDAAVYVQQMQNLNFAARSVHVGYYLLGAGFIGVLPGSDDYAINLLNCLLGAVSITVVYFITLAICHKYLLAIISGLLLLTHYIFVENSVYAEVYTPQTCFFLLASLFWLLDKPILAGLSFSVSCLMTPSTVFALPFFFVVRPRLRALVVFGVTVLIALSAAVYPVYKDYLFSSRGLLRAAHVSVNVGRGLIKERGEVLYSFFLAIPFLVAGLVELFRRKDLRPLGFGLVVLWAGNLFFGEKFGDVPVQLPTYALLCVAGGIGFGLLWRMSSRSKHGAVLSAIIVVALTGLVVVAKITKTPAHTAVLLPDWFLAVLVSFAVLCTILSVLPKVGEKRGQIVVFAAGIIVISSNGFMAFTKINTINKIHDGYRNTVLEMAKVARADYIAIGSWTKGILLEHYLYQKSYTDHWINTEWLTGRGGAWSDETKEKAIKKLNQAIADRSQIWLLGNYRGLFAGLQKKGYKIARFKSIYVANAKK